jgi:hypothetical protein
MFFELKYFQNKNISKDVSIQNIYFIYNDEIVEHSDSVNHLNDKIKYLYFLKSINEYESKVYYFNNVNFNNCIVNTNIN